jgi:hypothetical protein
LERFAWCFSRDFFVRKCFEWLNSEQKPELVGVRAAMETLFAAYRLHPGHGVPEDVGSYIEYCYADDMYMQLDTEKTAQFFAWLGVVQPAGAYSISSHTIPDLRSNLPTFETDLLHDASDDEDLRRALALSLLDQGDDDEGVRQALALSLLDQGDDSDEMDSRRALALSSLDQGAETSLALSLPPESSGSSDAKLCPNGCGFNVTWHATHCCGKCLNSRGHGPYCEKRARFQVGEEVEVLCNGAWHAALVTERRHGVVYVKRNCDAFSHALKTFDWLGFDGMRPRRAGLADFKDTQPRSFLLCPFGCSR